MYYFLSEDENIPPLQKEQPKNKWDDEDVDDNDVKESWEDEDEPEPEPVRIIDSLANDVSFFEC